MPPHEKKAMKNGKACLHSHEKRLSFKKLRKFKKREREPSHRWPRGKKGFQNGKAQPEWLQ